MIKYVFPLVSTSVKRVSEDHQSSIECSSGNGNVISNCHDYHSFILLEPELRMKLEVESKISKAKTLQLARHKGVVLIYQ